MSNSVIITIKNEKANSKQFIDLIERYNTHVKYPIEVVDNSCFESFYEDVYYGEREEIEIPKYLTIMGNPVLLDCSEFKQYLLVKESQ